ncbi:putative regulator of chromosome condensation 1/beta-lactamase-inhibitor protein II [Helianthus debilis subsp. tardiflorus]
MTSLLVPQTGFFSLVASDSRTMFRNMPVLILWYGVKQVACGHSHTLVSTQDGRIHGWGYNSYGQAANQKCTYAWYPSPIDRCVGEVRKLAAGGGHSTVLTYACSLKELCQFRLADTMTPWNASRIEDVAYQTGSDALVHLCERLRYIYTRLYKSQPNKKLFSEPFFFHCKEHHPDGGTCGY